MNFCKNYAVDDNSDLGFSIANANKDLSYFVQMVSDLGTKSDTGEATSKNLQSAVDAGMGADNALEIYDWFGKLEK